MTDLPNAGSGYPVGNIGREREHVLVVEDAVRGRIGIGIARVRPDRMRLSALVDGQPAVVAVESRLDSVRGCKDRRHHVEVERRRDVLTARENVVRGLGLNTRLRRGLGGARVLTGDARAAVIADCDVILAAAFHHVDRRHVVVQRRIRIYGLARRPGRPTIGRFRQLDVVLLVAVILPGHEQVPIRAIDPDARAVIGANERPRYTLLAPSTEVTPRLAYQDIVTDLGGCAAGRSTWSHIWVS